MYEGGLSNATAILATWRELVGTTLQGVQRLIFYGAAPPEIMNMFAVSATEIVVLVTPEDIYTKDWVTFPVNRWAQFEQFNLAAGQLLLPTPPITPTLFADQPPSYEQVTAESAAAAAAAAAAADIELISSDDGDDDDDVFIEL